MKISDKINKTMMKRRTHPKISTMKPKLSSRNKFKRKSTANSLQKTMGRVTFHFNLIEHQIVNYLPYTKTVNIFTKFLFIKPFIFENIRFQLKIIVNGKNIKHAGRRKIWQKSQNIEKLHFGGHRWSL